jgi:hypothetical protein
VLRAGLMYGTPHGASPAVATPRRVVGMQRWLEEGRQLRLEDEPSWPLRARHAGPRDQSGTELSLTAAPRRSAIGSSTAGCGAFVSADGVAAVPQHLSYARNGEVIEVGEGLTRLAVTLAQAGG